MKILFSRGGTTASTGMRGGWISYALSGCFNKHILKNNNVYDHIIVVLKQDYNNLNLLSTFKKSNKLILDVIDLLDVDKYNKNNNKVQPNFFPNIPKSYYDGYIVNNNKMKHWWRSNIDGDTSKPIFVIPHHWENRFKDLTCVDYKKYPYFYYLGYEGHEKQNCLHVESMLRDGLVLEHRNGTTNPYYKDKPLHGVQFNVRFFESWEYCFKPATKISVAAAMDSLIITTYDWSVQDILNSDYPYILKDSSYESLKNMIEYVNNTHNTDIAKKAKKYLQDAMDKTCLYNSIAPKYKNLLSHFY